MIAGSMAFFTTLHQSISPALLFTFHKIVKEVFLAKLKEFFLNMRSTKIRKVIRTKIIWSV